MSEQIDGDGQCEALCLPRNRPAYRCTRAATSSRNGHEVCTAHLHQPAIKYCRRVETRRYGCNFPAPDDRRCDAIAADTRDRCAHFATWFRDGRQVCFGHFRKPTIKYADECGDRVGAYREMMALALRDAD